MNLVSKKNINRFLPEIVILQLIRLGRTKRTRWQIFLFAGLFFSSSPAAAQTAPGSFTITGPTTVTGGTSTSYNPTTGTPPGSGYQWSLSVPSAGSITQVGNGCSITWSSTYSGSVALSCRAINQYGATNAPNLNITVQAVFAAGTITTGNQTINYNSPPAPITSTAASNCSGTYLYKWQSSPDGSTWTDLGSFSSSTSLTYQPPALTSTLNYRLACNCGSTTLYTNAVQVYVYPQLIPANISPASQTVDYNSSIITTLSTSTSASGGNGTFSYQWWVSTDNINWVLISGQTNTFYTPSPLTSIHYYRLVTTSNNLPANSNTATVSVYPQLTAVTVAPTTQSINYNTAPTLVATATGGSGNFNSQWQSSPTGNSWTDVPGMTGLTPPPFNLTNAVQYFHVIVTPNGGGAPVTSNAVTVNVYPQLTVNPASPTSETIGYNGALLPIVAQATGGNGTIAYQWQSSPTGLAGSWNNVTAGSGATSSSYTPAKITGTTYYQEIATSNGVPVTSGPVSVTVYPQLVTGSVIAGNQSINYNTTPTIALSVAAATGSNGVYAYKWQISSDNLSWNDISGANNTSYTILDPLTANMYYHLISTGFNNESVTSNLITVIVYPQLIVASPSPANQAVNYNGTLSPISAVATGGNGTITYQWQSSTTGTAGTYSNVTGGSGATTSSYTPTLITGTTYYQEIATSNGVPITGNAATVTVYPQLIVASPSPANQVVNYNGTLSPISAVATGGNGTITYQWQSSTTGTAGTYSNVTGGSGATTSSYTPALITGTTYYQEIATSNGVPITGNAATVTVYPQLIVASPSPANQAVNYNGTLSPISAVATGGNGTITYQWQSSTTGTAGTYANVTGGSGATISSYIPANNITGTTYYQEIATSNGLSVTSNAVTATVYPQLTVALPSPANQAVNYNGTLSPISAIAIGGNGTITYQWQSSTTGTAGTYANVTGGSGATTSSYTPALITGTTYYQEIATSNGLFVTNNAVTVTVYPQLIVASPSPATQAVNYNGTLSPISAIATGGNGTITYQWQSSTTGTAGTFTNVTGGSGATTSSYTPANNITGTTY
jgi:hypothetical protein